jgi:hypothetical protein
MALIDLIRKRVSHRLTTAIAIPATPAICEEDQAEEIAKIAQIAIATIVMDVPLPTIQHLEELRMFRFELIEEDIDEGYSSAILGRINNMAWEFMQVDGMSFYDAIRIAAEIVSACEVAACESAYEDVQALWRKLNRGQNL